MYKLNRPYMLRSACLTLAILFLSVLGAVAQDCAVNLRNAENLFNSGLVEEVPELLESCLQSGFTKAEELSAYKLIIRSYLFDDKTELAEQMMLEFLKKNPEYEISPTDNGDFIYLFNKYRVKPVIQLGIHGGVNMTYVTGISQNSVSGNSVEGKYNNESVTLVAGGILRYRFSDKFELGLEINYSEASYTYTERFLGYQNIIYNKKQRRLVAPLNAYYSPWSFGGFIPYLKLGAGVAYTFSTDGQPTTDNIDDNNTGEDPGATVDRIDYTIKLDPIISAGIGMKYKLPSSYVFLDIGTMAGIRNQFVPGKYSSLESNYKFTGNELRLNTLRFSVGYIFIIYKPEKIQE